MTDENLIEIRGKSPRRDSVGNSDCLIKGEAKLMVPVIGKSMHAIRCYEDVANIRKNTVYVRCNTRFMPNVIRTMNFSLPSYTVDESGRRLEIYEDLVNHMNNAEVEFYHLLVTKAGSSLDVIELKLNEFVFGYYVPEHNSFIFGNFAWHAHYITRIFKPLWDTIVSDIGLPEIDNALIGTTKKTRMAVTIGCDPEFELKGAKNRVLRASRHISTGDMYHSEIGVDGAGDPVEFRPKPGTPAQVVRNIKNLVRKFSEQYESFDLSPVGNTYALGGHVHVGIGSAMTPDKELLGLLDKFVGEPTLNLSGKARSEYKRLSAYREQPWGFEYRSMPSCVFENPLIAYSVMTVIKNLSEAYLSEETIKFHDTLTVQDYVTVGGLTEKQANYFMKFCTSKKREKSIRASWRVAIPKKPDVETYDVAIQFDGSAWNNESSIARYFGREVSELDSLIPGITVALYQLPPDVRNCCTMHSNTMDYFEAEKQTWNGNILQIGIARNLIAGSFRNSQLDEIMTIIKAELGKKVANV